MMSLCDINQLFDFRQSLVALSYETTSVCFYSTIDLAEIDYENDKFGVVSELRDGLTKIKESK